MMSERKNETFVGMALGAGATLSGVTTLLLLEYRYPKAPLAGMIFATAVLIAFFSKAARLLMDALSAWLEDLELAERALLIVLLVLLFATPSYVLRQWEPALGAVIVNLALILFFPARSALILVCLLSGLCHVLVLPLVSSASAFVHSLLFCGGLVVTAGALHFANCVSARHPPLGLGRKEFWQAILLPAVVTCVSTLAAFFLIPSSWETYRPHFMLPAPQPSQVVLNPELYAVGQALTRVSAFFFLLGAFAMLYWLHRRWRRRGKTETEEISEIEAELIELRQNQEQLWRRLRKARTPRGRIAEIFERFVEQASRLGFARRDSQTPAEYLTELAANAALSEPVAQAIMARFQLLRYGTRPVNKEDIQQFLVLVDKAHRELREGNQGTRTT